MKVWVLFVFLYSPAGELVGRYTFDYDSHQECKQHAQEENKKQHPMGIYTKAICKRITL